MAKATTSTSRVPAQRALTRYEVRSLSLIERVRLWAPEGPADACWLWTGGQIDKDGYGHLGMNGRRYRVHRVAWEHASGRAIPKGLVIRHRCHTPACTNPSHLTLGSQKQNIGDAVERGTWVHGETHGRAKLSTAEVIEIRTLLAMGRGPNSLGRQFGVSKTQIMRIRDGVARRDG